MDEQQHEILTVDELALYLKVPRSTVYALVQRRQIPSHKVGRHWRFHKPAIDQWLADRPAGGLERKACR